ncbi:MAG: hypothetical protein ACRERR_03800 [Moraxellaceae bacterium]
MDRPPEHGANDNDFYLMTQAALSDNRHQASTKPPSALPPRQQIRGSLKRGQASPQTLREPILAGLVRKESFTEEKRAGTDSGKGVAARDSRGKSMNGSS